MVSVKGSPTLTVIRRPGRGRSLPLGQKRCEPMMAIGRIGARAPHGQHRGALLRLLQGSGRRARALREDRQHAALVQHSLGQLERLQISRAAADSEDPVLFHRPAEKWPPQGLFLAEPGHRPPHRRHDVGHQQHSVGVGGVVADDQQRPRRRQVLEALTLDARQAGRGDPKDGAGEPREERQPPTGHDPLLRPPRLP